MLTRQQAVDLIANDLWLRGLGSRKGGLNAANDIVRHLQEQGVLTLQADEPIEPQPGAGAEYGMETERG